MKRTLLAALLLALPCLANTVRADAPSGRYNVQNGVMVLDTKTGLVWQKTPGASTYTWGASSAAGTAQNYCATLSLDGLGWRVPTLKELMTLIDYSEAAGNMTDPVFSSGPNPGFWSSTRLPGSTTNAWFVVLGYGSPNFSGFSTTYSVRCVR